jgi:hypothetical protein
MGREMSETPWDIIADIRRSMVPFEQKLHQATTQRHIPEYCEIDLARAARNIATRAEAIAALVCGFEEAEKLQKGPQ